MRKFILFLILILIVFLIYLHLDPLGYVMPVEGAKRSSYSQHSFWAYPWGTSGHHKGVDIFAKKGTPVFAATRGIVVFNGVLSKGGNAVLIFGPWFRNHYYAHLDQSQVHLFQLVSAGDQIGSVGTTGNAKGKAPHLHYSIGTMIPRFGEDVSGIKRFYHDPTPYLNGAIGDFKVQ
jgi:murein DD-endopeptidase MepM/ murein hydrolase activator NlpD